MRTPILALLLAAACAPSFSLPLPERFVALEDQDDARPPYRMRATTPDGVVLGVRTLDNGVEGSVTFWAEAVTRRLRDQLAYALLADEEVRAKSGEAGRLLRFGRDLEGHTYRYLVALYVAGDTLFLVEAGGREEPYAALEEAIEAAIADLSL
ncbi:MAG: hypothetical protein AAGH15_04105 [Myxococcota bacterium]